MSRDLYALHAPFVAAFFLFVLLFTLAHARSGRS
jgi:hypothetical protein